MSQRLLVLLSCLVAATAWAGSPRVYVLRWDGPTTGSDRSVRAEIDLGLRAELARRGARVVEAPERGAIVLRPSLVVSASALELHVVGVRAADLQVLGALKMKASGASQRAMVRAIVAKAGAEAERL